MFSTLTKHLSKNLTNNYNCKINVSRGLYWIRNEGENKYIGIDNNMVTVFEGIKNINFGKNTNILKGELLFSIESNTTLNQEFISKNDCIIVCKNKNAIKTINNNPEDSWILKIKDNSNSYGEFISKNINSTKKERQIALKCFLDSTRYTPYTYDNNSDKVKYQRNVNESDVINYMIGNH